MVWAQRCCRCRRKAEGYRICIETAASGREKLYSGTPYLAELSAAVFGIEKFAHHLIGKHFVIYTDHKPMEKLSSRQMKTLNRLQELMGKFDFELKHIDGRETYFPTLRLKI